MVDKQVIIYGIDVSECECFYINDSHPERKECINPYCKGLCKDNPNCYYKQLVREKQECDKAKQNAQDTYDLWQALIESFNILQGEKIKLEQECENWKEYGSFYLNKFIQFKQTLTEIKEIAKEVRSYLNCPSPKDVRYKMKFISEVENE